MMPLMGVTPLKLGVGIFSGKEAGYNMTLPAKNGKHCSISFLFTLRGGIPPRDTPEAG